MRGWRTRRGEMRGANEERAGEGRVEVESKRS